MVSFDSFPCMFVYIFLNFALFWDGWHIRFKHKFKNVFTNVWTTSNTDKGSESYIEDQKFKCHKQFSTISLHLSLENSPVVCFCPVLNQLTGAETPHTHMDQLVIKTRPQRYRHKSLTSEQVLRNMWIWSLNS